MPTDRLLRKLVYFFVPPIGVLVTLATGFFANNYYSYGFPLPWKTLVASGICPPEPWLQIPCYLRIATSYNWAYFALDALFYTGIGYALGLPPANFRKFLSSKVKKLLSMLSSFLKMRLKWRELATPFRVTALMGIVGGLYLTSTPLWPMIVSPFFSGLQPPTSESLNIVSVVAFAVFIAVPAISIGGAVSLLTHRMNDDQRGILSLFVTVCSFLPIVYLGFEIFAWILQEWQFAIITIFWSILLLMTTRIVRSRPRASR